MKTVEPDETRAKLSGDEYMELLVRRQTEFMELRRREALAVADSGRPTLPLLPPLLGWFIRDGDEHLVELPEPVPKGKPEPRYHRPVSYWRARIIELEARMSATAARADGGDRAAAGGCALGPKRTARHQERAEAALVRYVALEKKLSHAKSMLRSAEARESNIREDR